MGWWDFSFILRFGLIDVLSLGSFPAFLLFQRFMLTLNLSQRMEAWIRILCVKFRQRSVSSHQGNSSTFFCRFRFQCSVTSQKTIFICPKTFEMRKYDQWFQQLWSFQLIQAPLVSRFSFHLGAKGLPTVAPLQNVRRHFGLKSPLHFMSERTRTASEWEDASGRTAILELLLRWRLLEKNGWKTKAIEIGTCVFFDQKSSLLFSILSIGITKIAP